ncbi:MAG: hypothetical protein GTO71_01330 [Woeseiaceae bacterium]|nr:hypothetical protein [Woeseiaceae bacterium]NIP19762.1 hypothetical protein [Woeseiaceae bacterium]NIS89879.1 hypothetical protein [Woeseiaceae bacterium]
MKKLIIVLVALIWAPPLFADDEIGIFETILEASGSFGETTAALEQAIAGSGLQLHGTHDIRVPESKHKARLYVLTSPAFVAAASSESPRTASAHILRIAVFTSGDQQNTFVNMANPVAHAMIYFAESPNYDALVEAAGIAADEIRDLVKTIPGQVVSVQAEPLRSEKHYNKYKGDGPARMMAKFRKWEKSQLVIIEDEAANFDNVVERVVASLEEDAVANADEPGGWQLVSQIRLRDDVVHLGLTNPFIEDRMISINSRYRKEGKSNLSPYPGVDHVAALPTEVLIVREGGQTQVLHYGQMWRMQLYFWDSGYRAFTANMGVPGDIVNSIEEAVLE